MSKKNEESKKTFINVFLNKVENDTHSKDAAREFLHSEGLDVERIKSEGLNKIKQMQLLIQAKKTEEEMAAISPAAQRAKEWVDRLLSSASFSLSRLVQEEELTVSFSHMENLSQEEIRNLLIRHFTLKFMEE